MVADNEITKGRAPLLLHVDATAFVHYQDVKRQHLKEFTSRVVNVLLTLLPFYGYKLQPLKGDVSSF